MDSFEINKLLGALLGTCLVLLAVHIAAGAIFAPPVPAKPGYEIALRQEQPAQPAAGAAPTAAPQVPFENLLATASIQQGSQIARQCQACHNLGKGEGNKVGPDLYGVVARPVASVADFSYTAALKAKGGTWTFDALNTWLTDPRADVPGTAMLFAGISSEKQRADLVAYLNSNSDNPLPLPKAAQAAPATPAAAAAATPPANPPAQPPAAAPAKPPAAASIENLLATASIQQGSQIAKQCEMCHSLAKGQGNQVGPDLYGVVGRAVASVPDFGYSDALKAKGGTWTFDALNTWLTNPTADVPGTAMLFAGISSEKQRAALIAYLNSNSDNPLPLPKAAQGQPAPANPPDNAPPAPPRAEGSAPPQ